VATPSTRLALPPFMDLFRGRAVRLQFCENQTSVYAVYVGGR
jgi:hypothetical protein